MYNPLQLNVILDRLNQIEIANIEDRLEGTLIVNCC